MTEIDGTMHQLDGFDRFEAIGRLEEQLVGELEGLTSHWEVRGSDPVLTVRGDGVSVEVVPEHDGSFRLTTRGSAEEVRQLVAVLARRAAGAPARARSRRLAAALS